MPGDSGKTVPGIRGLVHPDAGVLIWARIRDGALRFRDSKFRDRCFLMTFGIGTSGIGDPGWGAPLPG